MMAYERLPDEILKRASRGNEYAWRVDDIPNVISAAQDAHLLNIGGQLQFRLPNGGICECYWIEVDTFRSVSVDGDWETRVAQSAIVALKDFEVLRAEYDFVAEGKHAFGEYLVGNSPEEMMWFVWYVEDQR